MTHLPVLVLGLVLMSCDSTVQENVASPAQVVGRYLGSWQVQSLELAEDGTYESVIFNGITEDGCGTIIGAGESRGAWSVDDGVVRFTPSQQTPDLLVDFAEAFAARSEKGLTLAHLGTEYPLKQTATPVVGPRRLSVEWSSTQ